MEKITHDVLSQSQSEHELPPSPKRPRTDCKIANGHGGTSRLHFPKPLTFQEARINPSLTMLMPKSADLECTAECEDDKYQNTEEQRQYIQPLANPMNRMTPPQGNEANTGSSDACFVIPVSSVLVVKDEQPPANENDKLSLYPPDYAGEAFEESHTSKDVSSDSSSQPDCDCLGKSLEDKPPGGSNLRTGNGGDGRQVQNGVSQIPAFNLGSSDEEVRHLSDFTCVDMLCDTGFCRTFSQYAGDEPYSQRSGEDGFSENILLNENEADSPISPVVHTDSELLRLISEEDPCGSMAEGVKSEEGTIKMQLCEDESLAVLDVKTKCHTNENGISKNPVPSAAEWAEGSIVSYDTVLVRNIGTETVSLDADDYCGAERAHAAHKMRAKTGSEMADHTTETPMPARISQEPAEGDNDAGPFDVISPAIWSESNGEAVEECCESESTAGAKLATFVEMCARDIPPCPDAQPAQEDPAFEDSRRHLCKEERDFCQSFTEAQARLTNTVKGSHNNDSSCEWTASSSSSLVQTPPVMDKTQDKTEQDQLCCFPDGLDNLLAQEVGYLLSEFKRMKGTTQETKGKETLDIEINRHEELECSMDLEKKLQGLENYREHTSEMSIDDFLNEWVEEKISIREESENNLGCLSDHPYSVVFPTAGETQEGSGKKKANNIQVNESSEVLVKLKDSELKRDTTKVSPDEHFSEHSEVTKSKSGYKLNLSDQRKESAGPCLWSVHLNRAEPAGPLASPSPPSTDALVLGPHEFRRSQTADQNPTASISGGRFSLLSSALPFCDRVLGAFDMFEIIKLSRDNDGDNDAGLSSSPLLTSMPKQRLETPQRWLHPTPQAESSEHEELPQEDEEGKVEDVERLQCHSDDIANGLSSCDYSCDELSNFISAADVPAHCWPEPKPDFESAFKSSESFQDELKPSPVSWDVSSKSDSSESDVNIELKFEMRQQFDKVLKELNLFFDVSKSEFGCYSGESSPEQCGDGTKTWESNASNCKDPLTGGEKDTSSDDTDEEQRLDVCGHEPVESCTPDCGDGEQEVPFGSYQEVSMPTSEKHKEPQNLKPKMKTWSPVFMCQPLLEQLVCRPPEPNRRLEPLRTCTRPLRVGLSKKAKTKHLHRCHPYK